MRQSMRWKRRDRGGGGRGREDNRVTRFVVGVVFCPPPPPPRSRGNYTREEEEQGANWNARGWEGKKGEIK